MVTVYSRPSCVQCNATYMALKGKGIHFEKVDLSQDLESLLFVQSLGHQQAPVVVTDDDHWSGFRPDKIEKLSSGSVGKVA